MEIEYRGYNVMLSENESKVSLFNIRTGVFYEIETSVVNIKRIKISILNKKLFISKNKNILLLRFSAENNIEVLKLYPKTLENKIDEIASNVNFISKGINTKNSLNYPDVEEFTDGITVIKCGNICKLFFDGSKINYYKIEKYTRNEDTITICICKLPKNMWPLKDINFNLYPINLLVCKGGIYLNTNHSNIVYPRLNMEIITCWRCS